MGLSNLVLWTADRCPWIVEPLIRSWLQWTPQNQEPHWLLPTLKRRFNVRVTRRVRMESGHELYVDPFDLVGERIARHGCFEPETVNLLRQLVRPGMIACDIGAHVGQYTVLLADLVGGAGQVHAFEPDPTTFATLQANVRLNRLRNVTCNHMALSEASGTATLFLANIANTGANSLRQTDSFGGQQAVVQCDRLDDYCAGLDLASIGFIKIDVEGGELPVLRGGETVLSASRPHLLLEFSSLTSCFGYSTQDLQRFLQERGYELFLVTPAGIERLVLPRPPAAVDNVLAVHTSHVEEVAPDRR
jgi:FkbM family methyltransferase